jgi:hypothetical protein
MRRVIETLCAVSFAGLMILAGCGKSTTGNDLTTPAVACESPTANLVGGEATGYETCKSGAVHRKAVTACPSMLPRAAACNAMDPAKSACSKDADCVEKANGFCELENVSGQCGCAYGCTQDSDCSAGEACLCGDPVGRCVRANCKSDADCAGELCTTDSYAGGCGPTALACQTPQDECAASSDCAAGESCVVQNGVRKCAAYGCD